MERRDFLKASCCTGFASLTGASLALGQISIERMPGETATEYAQRLARERALLASRAPGVAVAGGRRPDETSTEYAQRIARERAMQAATFCYALWRYTIENPAQRRQLTAFAEAALIPALNRAGFDEVGAFLSADGPAYLLFGQRSLGSMTSLSERLARDEEYTAVASAFLEPSVGSRPYQRMDSQLFMSLDRTPETETPVSGTRGVLQLVTYEGLGIQAETGMVEMFEAAGLAVLRQAGADPMFVGRAIAGERMPNLTCLLSAENPAAHEAASRALANHPECNVKAFVHAITSQHLKPMACSQI